ncbi:MAG: DUF456 domain-containing protein [Bacteroidota bacterium]
MTALTIFLIVGAIALVALGIIGCIVPGLPGPLLSWLAVLAYSFTGAENAFGTSGILIWGVVAVIGLLADFIVPAAATKKFGGTKAGIWGGIIGTFIGLSFPPIGLILGPLLGAIAGDLLGGKQIQSAMKSGFGNFLGFVVGTVIKLVIAIVIGVVVLWRITAFAGGSILGSF